MTDQSKHQKKSQKLKEKVDAGIAKATVEQGVLIVLTGNGKGKSTSGFGTVCRAVGHGYKAAVAQFIKGQWECGERNLLEKSGVPFHIMKTGFTWDTQDKQLDTEAAQKVWNAIKPYLENPDYHLVLLDELTYMLSFKYLDQDEVLETLKNRPKEQSVIITGRGAPTAIRELADTVSEIKELKHAYNQGIMARKGIDW